MPLKIGKGGFSLPIELVTSTQAVLARQEPMVSLLGEGERKLLTLLIAKYPESLQRVELARQDGYSNEKSGGFAVSV